MSSKLSVSDQVFGPYAKVRWARDNINHAVTLFESHLAGNRPVIVKEPYGDTGLIDVKLKALHPFPVEVARYFGYAIYDLRSSLELLATVMAKNAGCPDHLLKTINFPFGNSEQRIRKKLFEPRGKGTPALSDLWGEEFSHIVLGAKPYDGVQSHLYHFSRIANHDRHFEILPVGNVQTTSATFKGIRVDGGIPRREGTIAFMGGRGNIYEGIPISRIGPNGSFAIENYDGEPPFQITTEICFGETEFFEGEVVIEVLEQTILLIEDIITDARRLL